MPLTDWLWHSCLGASVVAQDAACAFSVLPPRRAAAVAMCVLPACACSRTRRSGSTRWPRRTWTRCGRRSRTRRRSGCRCTTSRPSSTASTSASGCFSVHAPLAPPRAAAARWVRPCSRGDRGQDGNKQHGSPDGTYLVFTTSLTCPALLPPALQAVPGQLAPADAALRLAGAQRRRALLPAAPRPGAVQRDDSPRGAQLSGR